jgi:hypothetical protein
MVKILLATLILLALVLFAKLLQKCLKLHTRERFAFYAVAAAMTLAWPFVYQLAPEIEVVFEVVTKWFSLVVKSGSRQLDFKFLLVAFAVFVLVLIFMYLIYTNWGAQKNECKEKDVTGNTKG